MLRPGALRRSLRMWTIIVFAVTGCVFVTGCQEVETLKREALKVIKKRVKTKDPFTPRDGITMRACPLYGTANVNSEPLRKLPAETQMRLIDKMGDWFRVRTLDGREGYIKLANIGGEEIIHKTLELRKSIEGMPVQAEGVLKNKANFRLEPGRQHKVVETLPAGRKFEMYERVVTLRPTPRKHRQLSAPTAQLSPTVMTDQGPGLGSEPEIAPKDVWYKVRIEDGRVGYIYTHNLQFTPPADIARIVNYMRIVAWRVINTTQDPDLGAMNDYVAVYAPLGQDPGCDYTRLYYIPWLKSKKKHEQMAWRSIQGVLPVMNYHAHGKPGFSVRYLHPTRSDKLVMANFVIDRRSRGIIKLVSQEEIPRRQDLY